MLLKEHLITSSEELYQSLADIDIKFNTERDKKAKKLGLLKLQVKLRKKVLKENIKIFFSRLGKHRLLDDILQDLGRFVDCSSTSHGFLDGFSLVGKRITINLN